MRKFCCTLFVIFTGITAFAQTPNVIEYTVTATFANLRGGPGDQLCDSRHG